MLLLYLLVLIVGSMFFFHPIMLSTSPCPCRLLDLYQMKRNAFGLKNLSRRDAPSKESFHPDAEIILKEFYNHMIDRHWSRGNITRASPELTRKKLKQELPKIIYNASDIKSNLTDLCSFLTSTVKPKHEDESYDKLPINQVYGYGTLAVLIISFCSLAGIICLPMIQWSTYRHLITGFIAFGLGVMMGDAVLHLIPEALVITQTIKEDRLVLWRCLFIMITIYGLFTFESLMELVHQEDEASHRCPRRHSHSHIPFPEDFLKPGPICKSKSPILQPIPSDISSVVFEEIQGVIPRQKEYMQSLDTFKPGLSDSESGDPDKIRKPKVEFNQANQISQSHHSKGWKTLALVIILGDTIHNFGDGLAVGAAFTSGVKSGVSTSLAIFCHELPHEFGDFVILMTSGLSFRRALIVNLGSAITAFLGLYVGIMLGDNQTGRRWIFAFTAGTFIYIAIGDMLPELRNHNKNFSVFIVQNISMVLGMALMMTVAVYEHGMFAFF